MKFYKRAFLFLLVFFPIFSYAFDLSQKPSSFVSDFANILTSDERSILEQQIESFEKEKSWEIAIVTLPSLGGQSIEVLAQDIFEKWGIGKKDLDNGVLILVSMAERKSRIHTGYGAEGNLTDLQSSYILEDVLAEKFREGKYFEGFQNSLNEVMKALAGENILPENYEKYNNLKNDFNGLGIISDILPIFFFLFFGFINLILSILAKSKSWWGGGVLGAIISSFILYFSGITFVFGSIFFVFMVLSGLGIDFLVSRAYEKGTFGKGNKGFWGGFGSGGGRGGGGFGGFGGGRSGGGGSSGGW